MQAKKTPECFIVANGYGASSDMCYRAGREVVARLRRAGFDAWFAGGCVRDRLLCRPIKDIDVATNARPDAVEQLFDRSIAVGKAFGVIRVLLGGYEFEVATFREDIGVGDGRRPEAVRFATVADDARRRDFTVNALFEDPEDGTVLDFVGGMSDLRNGVIRAIGDPRLRFREDRLRLLRAARFSAVLGFAIEPGTAKAIRHNARTLTTVSGERQGTELTRLLTEAIHAGDALRQLDRLGLLGPLLPEVAAMKAVQQPPRFHPEGDVFRHTCLMLNRLPPPVRDATLVYAVLLHDVGKPPTAVCANGDDPDRRRFPNHAAIGADLATQILKRLRRPAALTQAVESIVRRHMTFPDLPNMRPAKQRRFMGAATFALECELLRLDSLCSCGDLTLYHQVMALRKAHAAEPVLPAPWVRGRDLVALGMPPGPAMGRLLKRAYDAQLEACVGDRAALLRWVQERLRQSD